jgi:AcrR family transcriptional regulator
VNDIHWSDAMSRRERIREGTREEIKALAREQMTASGTAALSLGAIARSMEMVPSALYRYYRSRDELITALIVDAYHALADALFAAASLYQANDYRGRLLAASLAYREWAVGHAVDFLLIFGNPIPGYEAPAQETEPAALRLFSQFLQIMQEAYVAGVLRPPAPHEALVARGQIGKPIWYPAIDALVNYTGVACWSRIHGMVMLELTGHLHPGLEPARFYHSECERILVELGLVTGDE